MMKDNIATVLDRAMKKGAGHLRLTPVGVPSCFLHSGEFDANRGCIDELWFASSTEAGQRLVGRSICENHGR